jgi:hypothetical protein
MNSVSRGFLEGVPSYVKTNFGLKSMGAALLVIGFSPYPMVSGEATDIIPNDILAANIFRGLYWGPDYYENGVLRVGIVSSDLVLRPIVSAEVRGRIIALVSSNIPDISIELMAEYTHPYKYFEERARSSLVAICSRLAKPVSIFEAPSKYIHPPANPNYQDFLSKVLEKCP